ncbi:uncharacterized protein LODBEIA_P54700 [Lodderomyces beijingensis]|uniref:YMC020W-like alpha/beta hydrolase domain-containing protein n=1 Tax=Lodderomyces beijingensis TaxID=1775926 RepID=A0ABP0ZSY8_9ASCO
MSLHNGDQQQQQPLLIPNLPRERSLAPFKHSRNATRSNSPTKSAPLQSSPRRAITPPTANNGFLTQTNYQQFSVFSAWSNKQKPGNETRNNGENGSSDDAADPRTPSPPVASQLIQRDESKLNLKLPAGGGGDCGGGNNNSSSWYSYYSSILFPRNESLLRIEDIPLLSPERPASPKESTNSDFSQAVNSEQSWFGWLFSHNPFASAAKVEDGLTEMETTNEAYKSAKSAIEGAKDECHYVYYSGDGFKTFELAVFGTMSEQTPVHVYSRKDRPVSPNELFEKSLRRSSSVSVNELAALNEPPPLEASRSPRVVPTFEENYRESTLKTKLRIFSKDVVCGIKTEHHLYRKPSVHIKKTVDKLKRITIIGVHNFLPTKMVRALIGESTGTSIHYARRAARAVKSWLAHNGAEYESEYSIRTIAIDGQGKSHNCVEKSVELLANWKTVFEQSDFIFFVSYSTSVPIAVNIFARLFQKIPHLKHNQKKKMALLSMSGNFLGPVPSHIFKIVYRAYTQTENEIVRESFELERKDSHLAEQLHESMQFLVAQNVRFVFTSDLDEAFFIPLYSSWGLQFQHPNIHRNMFQHNNDASVSFISSTFKLICMMKNLGQTSDYNIIKELGDKLDVAAKNRLSRMMIYEEEEVYFEALNFALGSTSLNHKRDLKIVYPRILTKPSSSSSSTSATASSADSLSPAELQLNFQNVLPWTMRGLLQDLVQYQHIDVYARLRELIRQFDEWKPTSKPHRDVKYCLDALTDFDLAELVQ